MRYLAILVGIGCWPSAALAHEMGVVQVAATFAADATYCIDITVDPSHLAPGADSGAVLEPEADVPLRHFEASDRAKIEPFLAEFLAGASLQFDEQRAVPTRAFLATPGTFTARWTGDIPAGAQTFRWSTAMPVGIYLLTLRQGTAEEVARQWVAGGDSSKPFALDAKVVPLETAAAIRLYLALGFTHILPKGLDHILFVLGISLLSQRLRPVLAQVTAFTVAHTLTLGLSIYGVVSLPAAVVEPLIALSIAYVAIENVLVTRLSPWRIAFVFGFGLLHGLGFAGVLRNIGLPRAQFLTALLSFNVGVEAGQMAVIFGAFLALGLPWRHQEWYRRRVVIPLSLAVAAVGLYWAIERTLV
jgi:hydrogenase/urease accessory protein HupE